MPGTILTCEIGIDVSRFARHCEKQAQFQKDVRLLAKEASSNSARGLLLKKVVCLRAQLIGCLKNFDTGLCPWTIDQNR